MPDVRLDRLLRQEERLADLPVDEALRDQLQNLDLPRRRLLLQLTQRRQPRQRLALELANPLASQIQLVPDRLERPGLALEAEAQLEDAPLALRQSIECLAHTLPAQRLLGLVERIRSLAIGEQVTELAYVVRTEGLVQRDRRVRGAESLVDVLQG